VVAVDATERDEHLEEGLPNVPNPVPDGPQRDAAGRGIPDADPQLPRVAGARGERVRRGQQLCLTFRREPVAEVIGLGDARLSGRVLRAGRLSPRPRPGGKVERKLPKERPDACPGLEDGRASSRTDGGQPRPHSAPRLAED
jgi:antitoxin (DNA-binding transcriptional repressor) of toxin-antitoxin stability system